MATAGQTSDDRGPAGPPTRVRFGVLALLCSLALVLYLDRVCIGQAGVSIERDLGLSHSQFGWVLGAFTIAYGLFEVPTGRWGDRFGSRGVLARIVVWWSVFTALTGAATGLASLIAVRFLFGAGEAGAYPNAARVIARWFPLEERGRVQGLMLTSAQLGAVLAPMVAAALIELIGWRWTFAVFSTFGLVWAGAFYAWFRDDPATHRGTNDAERALIAAGTSGQQREHSQPIPWRRVLTSRNVWLLGTVQTCSSFVSYMYMSWYPTYLQKGRGVEPLEASRLSSLVLAGAMVGCVGSGFVTDYLARVTGRNPLRHRLYGFLGTAAAAAALLASIECASPLATSLWASLAFLAAISQQATFWTVTMEISGRHLGAVFGLLNSLGVPGAFVSTVFLGRFADWMADRGYEGRAQWDPAFYVYAVALAIGACCWLGVDTRHKIDDSAPAADLAPEPEPT